MIHLIQQTIVKGEEYNQDVGKNNIFNAGRKGKLVKDKKGQNDVAHLPEGRSYAWCERRL